MLLNEIQETFVRSLNKSNIQFLVIGGKAVLEYSSHRTSSDLDVLLCRSEENAKNVASILRFDYQCPNPNEGTLEEKLTHKMFKLSYPNEAIHHVDILTSVGDLDFSELFRNSKGIIFEDFSLHIPSIQDLIAMKLISRDSNNDVSTKQKDILDIDALKKIIAL